MLLRELDVRRKAKRSISASNLNDLKGKGKTRYTKGSRGLLSLALPWGSPSPEIGQGLYSLMVQ